MISESPMIEQKLDQLQRAAFRDFLRTGNPANGLIADTSRDSSPASIGVVEFALSAYPVAVERGWMTRADAVERSLATLRFVRDSDQSGSPEAAGHKDFYYHFLAATSPLTTSAAACAADHVPIPELTVGPLDAGHTLLGRVLARIVKPDGVDSASLRSAAADLDGYRAQLAKALLPSDAAAKKALFINAYNAWTLTLVARLLPADPARWTAWSIKDGGSTLASVWKRHSFELGGRRYTLTFFDYDWRLNLARSRP